MTTFLAMKNRIVDETLRDDLTATQLTNAINDAIKTWEGERFAFNERRYLLDTVPSQEYYGLATPDGEVVIEIDSITVTVSNWPYPLTPRTQQWFDQHQALPAQHRGQPDSYALYGDQIRLFPIPDAAGPNAGSYQITISALARLSPVPLAQDTHTNAWLTEAEALIREQAKLILYRATLRDEAGAALAKDAITEAQWSLKRKMAGKAMTGAIRPWSL